MKDCIQKMEEFIADALVPINMQEYFDNILDECYSLRAVGGPFAHMQPSQVLKECDPVAYRCGVADVYDSDAMCIIGDEYYWREEAEREITRYIAEVLDEEMQSLLGDIEDLDDEDDHRQELEKRVIELQKDIDDCENHTF